MRHPPSPTSTLSSPTPPPKTRTPSLRQTIQWRPLGLSDAKERVLELRLFYEYTRSTCNVKSFHAMLPVLCDPIWEFDIPQIAFSSDIVLNALLGLSALHLQTKNPNDPILARASLSYLDKAVSEHRAALARVDEHTAKPLLVAAILIAHHTGLTAHSKDPTERYSIDLRTYHLCRGIKVLVQKLKPWLEKYEWPSPMVKPSPVECMPKKIFMLNAKRDLDLLSKAFNSDGITFERQVLYEVAAKELMGIYLLIASDADIPTIEQTIITYLHRLPSGFIRLLENEDPIAMAILARQFSTLSIADDSPAWWIHGAGDHKVAIKAVLGIQGLMPTEWLWTMDWPVQIVRKEIDLNVDCTSIRQSEPGKK
jgi:hypothetical protein